MHLSAQLPRELPELLNQLRDARASETMRAFGLGWANEVLKGIDTDSVVYGAVFSKIVSILTTDSSAKLRSGAAKCLLELLPSCSNAVQAHAPQLAAAACLGLADMSQDVMKDCERLLSSIAPLLAHQAVNTPVLDSNQLYSHSPTSIMPLVRHTGQAAAAEAEEMDLSKHRRQVHWEASSLDLGLEAMQQLLSLLFEGLDAQLAPAGPRRPVRQLLSCWRMATELEESDEPASPRCACCVMAA